MPNHYTRGVCHSLVAATNTNKSCGSQNLSGDETKAAEASINLTTTKNQLKTTEVQKSVPLLLQSRMPNIKVFSGSSHPDLAQRIVGK